VVPRVRFSRESGVKHINLSTKEEEITISLGDCSILESPLLNYPSTKRMYINLTVDNLEATTYF
jgi:hypothetical protein